MLHCFECGADLPDNIVYCLQCGTPLDVPEDETVVRPKPIFDPDIEPRPVVPIPVIEPTPVPVPVKRRSVAPYLILGVVLGAGLVIGLLIVGSFMLAAMQNDRNGNIPANNKNIAAVNSPSATATHKPTATFTATPADSNTNSTAALRDCAVISPDGEGVINLRRFCDTRDCSQDASTLYLQVDPGTEVQATSRDPIKTGHYTWVQIKYDGELLWVSNARLDCEHDF